MNDCKREADWGLKSLSFWVNLRRQIARRGRRIQV